MVDFYPSGFREVEVRKGDEAFCVNLHIKKCACRMWELSGLPCVHAVAGYLHMKMDLELGVSEWYTQNKWFEAYQYSIRPVTGSKYWKPTNSQNLYHQLRGKCQVGQGKKG